MLLRLSRSTFLVCVVQKEVCFLKGSRSHLRWFLCVICIDCLVDCPVAYRDWM